MNFNFMPLKLNTDIAYFKDTIDYFGSDNGIDLYKVKNSLKVPLMGLGVTDVNLYFFEANLITVYIHLVSKSMDLGHVRQTLENRIKEQGKALKIDSTVVIGWESTNEFLGLVHDKTGKRVYLYYTLKEFSIYNL